MRWLFGVVVIGFRVGFVTVGLPVGDKVSRCARCVSFGAGVEVQGSSLMASARGEDL